MNIYIDGIYDLFHAGHVETLKYIKDTFKGCKLIVGVVNNRDAEAYKRLPIINEKHRYIMLESCKYVDHVIKNAPLIVKPEFITENNIDLVVHSFADQNDKKKQLSFFQEIIDLNKFEEIPYSTGLSTSSIIKNIKDFY